MILKVDRAFNEGIISMFVQEHLNNDPKLCEPYFQYIPLLGKKPTVLSTFQVKMNRHYWIQIFQSFSSQTSLHGYTYIENTNSICLKFLWSIVILGMTVVSGVFFTLNTTQYFDSGITTTINTSTASLEVYITATVEPGLLKREKNFHNPGLFPY